MLDNTSQLLADYGRQSGYNQIAPGKDSPKTKKQSEDILQAAIMGGLPVTQGYQFNGAIQTLGGKQVTNPGLLPSAGDYNNAQALARQNNQSPPSIPGLTPNQQALDRQNGTFTFAPTNPVTGGPASNGMDLSNPMDKPDVYTRGTLPNSNANTDGYPTPGYMPEHFSGPILGWDATKWNDPNHQTPKYVIGKIISQYAPSPEGISKALSEIQKAYPGAQFNGKDKISLDGGRTWVDILTNSGAGQNMSWAWMPDDGGQANPNNVNPVLGSAIMNTPPTQQSGDSFSQKLREQILQSLLKTPLSALAGQYLK